MMPDPATLALFTLLAAPAAAAVLSLVPLPGVSQAVSRVASILAFIAAVGLLAGLVDARWGGYLGLDPVSEVFLFMVTGIYSTSVWYSRRYLGAVHRAFLTPQVYYALLSAFAFAMIAVLVVTDLGLMWIGVEATTVASALLIVLERKPASVEAAWRYTLIASAGLTIALFALLILYTATGTLDGFRLAASPPALSLPIEMAVALALVGYGTKVGLFPMHSWLPDAHSEAPSPVSAMFSGVLLPTALYAFLRVYRVLPSPAPALVTDLILAFGIATALVAAFLLQRQRSFKRLFAYSSMEVMGLAVIGIAIGGIALYGALILIVAHAFAKSAAFYCAGDVLRATGTTRIDDVRNLRERMPWTSGVWLLSSAAVTGAPPFGTFLGELLIVVGALAIGLVWVAGVVVVAILVAFLGVNSQVGTMIFGEPRSPAETGSKLSDDGWGIAGLNVAFTLVLGVAAIPYLAAGIRAAAVLLGGAHA
jgi:hydrogenase-4 component F